MDTWRLLVFVNQIEQQCRLGILAFDDLNKALQAWGNLEREKELLRPPTRKAEVSGWIRKSGGIRQEQVNQEYRLWYSIQNLLTAAANVSRFFWPGRPRGGGQP